MKIVHRYIKWDSHPDEITVIIEILNRYHIEYEYQEDLESIIPNYKYSIEFILYEDHKEFFRVKSELNTIIKEQIIVTEYEESDYENSDWFKIQTGQFQYPQPEDGYINLTFNTSNYCEVCGIGKIQKSPFRLKKLPAQKGNQFWGLHWEFEPIFVRNETRLILEKENIKEITFTNPVLNKNGAKVEDLFQLNINHILQPGFNSYNTKAINCKLNNEDQWDSEQELNFCGRIKFHHPRIGGYLFEESIFKKQLDLVKTSEYFGSGASANRLNICSKRFMNIVKENNLKGLSLIPIQTKKFERKPTHNNV